MADNSRIDDLRRRVQKDPASIAFAQLAEECRRGREYQEAIDICRAGLEIHPGYLSARVTLGRALVETGNLDEAQAELQRVLQSAPENLAAIRGLAEIYHRRGDLPAALEQYRAALLLARNDPDLEETIADLARQVEPAPEPTGLTVQSMQEELLKNTPPPPPADAEIVVEEELSPAPPADDPPPSAESTQRAERPDGPDSPDSANSPEAAEPPQTAASLEKAPSDNWSGIFGDPVATPGHEEPPRTAEILSFSDAPADAVAIDNLSAAALDIGGEAVPDDIAINPVPDEIAINVVPDEIAVDLVPGEIAVDAVSDRSVPAATEIPASEEFADFFAADQADSSALAQEVAPEGAVDARPYPSDTLTPPVDDRAARTLAALDQWLDAIHVARADRHP